MRHFRFLAIIIGISFLSACSNNWTTHNVSNSLAKNVTSARTPAQIEIFEGNATNQNYTVIKDIVVNVNKTTAFNKAPTAEVVRQKLREQAAKIGADAIINTKITDPRVTLVSWGARKGTATAVRYN